MMARFKALPLWLRVLATVAGSALAVLLLLVLYDWLGASLIDTGGTIG